MRQVAACSCLRLDRQFHSVGVKRTNVSEDGCVAASFLMLSQMLCRPLAHLTTRLKEGGRRGWDPPSLCEAAEAAHAVGRLLGAGVRCGAYRRRGERGARWREVMSPAVEAGCTLARALVSNLPRHQGGEGSERVAAWSLASQAVRCISLSSPLYLPAHLPSSPHLSPSHSSPSHSFALLSSLSRRLPPPQTPFSHFSNLRRGPIEAAIHPFSHLSSPLPPPDISPSGNIRQIHASTPCCLSFLPTP